MPYDDTNRGVLFTNDRKNKENQPDFNGKLNVDGKEYSLSAWKKTSKNDGRAFLSISISEPRKGGPVTRAKSDNGFFDE